MADRDYDIVEEVLKIAEETSRTPTQVMKKTIRPQILSDFRSDDVLILVGVMISMMTSRGKQSQCYSTGCELLFYCI